ncbi:unnamed protein product, partial [Closterium sp. NIES-53]
LVEEDPQRRNLVILSGADQQRLEALLVSVISPLSLISIHSLLQLAAEDRQWLNLFIPPSPLTSVPRRPPSTLQLAEEDPQRRNLVILSGADQQRLEALLVSVMHDFAACVLMALESWVLHVDPIAAIFLSPLDNPNVTPNEDWDFAACVLMALESWVLHVDPIAAIFLSPLDNPSVTPN